MPGAERLGDADIDMIERNISCPNVKEGGVSFGTDPPCGKITEAKKVLNSPIVKLSPNVTDIVSIAKPLQPAGRCNIADKYTARYGNRYKHEKTHTRKYCRRIIRPGNKAGCNQNGLGGKCGRCLL